MAECEDANEWRWKEAAEAQGAAAAGPFAARL